MSRIMIAFHVALTGAVIWETYDKGWLALFSMLFFNVAFWSPWIITGLYLSRGEPLELRRIVCELLDAEPITPLPSPPESS